MSREPDDHNLINFIAATVETMRDQMAKKSDIARVESRLETSTAVIRGDIEQVSFDSIQLIERFPPEWARSKTKSAVCVALYICWSRTSPTCCDCLVKPLQAARIKSNSILRRPPLARAPSKSFSQH